MTTPMTKDELHRIADTDHVQCGDAAAMARMLLASLDSEPVAWLVGEATLYNPDTVQAYVKRSGLPFTPLYAAAQPAPISMKDHQIRELVNELRDIAVEYYGTQQLRERIARALREAMIQGKADPMQAVTRIECDLSQIDTEKLASKIRELNVNRSDQQLAIIEPEYRIKLPDGWVAVPIEPTESMIVDGFESEPDEDFSDTDVWEEYQAMSGCQQAAHRAKLCWAAMISAAPRLEVES